jgi:hypothetical protein
VSLRALIGWAACGAIGVATLAAAACGGSSPVRSSEVPQVAAGPPPPPSPKNTPPAIVSLAAQGSRPREPARFADLGEEIAVTAVVEDAETPLDALTYEWTSESTGGISGSGRSVVWRAPTGGSTPFTTSITLTVIERFAAVDSAGVPVQNENRVSREIDVRVHDSARELQDRAKRFLDLFSQSSVAPDDVMRDFQDGCGAGGTGKRDERNDVDRNRAQFLILDWFVANPRVTIDFGGVSPFRARQADGWAAVDVTWRSRCLVIDNSRGCPAVGVIKNDVGTDWVTAHFDEATDRWWLCDSDYEAK